MSIILLRHGATELNRARVLQPPDTELSVVGQAQADAVARALALLRPSGLISSDLPRALQTARPIARAAGLGIASSALLQERNFGELSGKAYGRLGFDPLNMVDAPSGGESAAAFGHRVDLAFAKVLALRATLPGPLVVVSHGLVIRAMLAGPIGLAAELLATLQIANTAVTIIGAQAPHQIELLNSTSHLEADLLDGAGGLFGG